MRSDNWRQTVQTWRSAGLDIADLTTLVNSVMESNRVPNGRVWLYFCGAVRNLLSQRQELAARLLAEKEAVDA